MMPVPPKSPNSADKSSFKKKPCPPKQKPPCKVCKLIRAYLMFAVPILFLAFAGVKVPLPEDLDMSAVIGHVFLGILLLVVGWRLYTDYFRKK